MVSAREALRKVYGDSRNFISPRIIETGWVEKGEVAYELSYGLFLDKHVFGISVVRKDNVGAWQKDTAKSTSVFDADINTAREEIEEALERLKN